MRILAQFRNCIEHTGSDEESAVIEPSRGWDNEAVDDRHSRVGTGASCRDGLRTPHLYTAIGTRLLQTVNPAESLEKTAPHISPFLDADNAVSRPATM